MLFSLLLLGCPSPTPSATTPGPIDTDIPTDTAVPTEPGTPPTPPTPDPWNDRAVGLEARPAACSVTIPPPSLLSQVDCFTHLVPDERLVPYRLNAPFYSDGAQKQRYLSLPEGTALHEGSRGELELPPGGITVKTFAVDGQPVEVRFAVKDEAGAFHAFTYVWRADGSDAELTEHGTQVGDWTVPSGSECLECHIDAAGSSLGLSLGQLKRTVSYDGEQADQLATLQAIGFVRDLEPPEHIEGFEPLDGDPLLAARSYLDSNCAACHRPGGTGGGALDFRHGTSNTGACEVPEFGSPGPDEPLLDEVILFRLSTTDSGWAMPPLAREVPDPVGAHLISAWIEHLECE